jgi:uncharacterized protein YggL (DUF469 family)
MAINKKNPGSASRIKRLTSRQRKKRRVGEFKELGFEVDLVFDLPMDGEPYGDFMSDLFLFLESRALLAGGFGGRKPLLETGGFVARIERGSVTEADAEAIIEWLRARPEVRDARASHLFDAWHGRQTAEL